MQCPKCVDTLLKTVVVKSKNIELDRCPDCMGFWFEDKELSAVLGARAKKNFSIPHFATLQPGAKCPHCHKGLYTFCYPGTMTLVDACKTCHGIWLDNNELKEIHAARNLKNRMHCPKCSTRQMKSDTCVSCGVVFAKFHAAKEERLEKQHVEAAKKQESYADDIPGVKGKLLRFIDSSIESLTGF